MKKRLISLLLASMMVFALAVPAMADDPPTYAGVVQGYGNVVAPPHVIEVTLPTAPLTFLVDTEGVIGETPVRGAIVFRSGEVQTIINRSSRALNVGVEFVLATDDTVPANEITFLNAVTNVNDNGKYAFIRARVSTANVENLTTDFAGTNVQALGLAPQTATFRIPAAAFDVVEQPADSGNFVRVKNATTPAYQGTQLELAGQVSSHTSVNWSGDEVISIRIRFAFSDQGVSLTPATPLTGTGHQAAAMHLIGWIADDLTDFIAQTMAVGGVGAAAQNITRAAGNRTINFDWASLPDGARLGSVTIGGSTVAATAGAGDRTANRIIVTGAIPASVTAGNQPMVVNLTSSPGTPSRTLTVNVQ